MPGLKARHSLESEANEVACASQGCIAIGDYVTARARHLFTSTYG